MSGRTPRAPRARAEVEALADVWRAEWPCALRAWSKLVRLHPPLLCSTEAEAREAGLTGSFAMIRLTDQSVVVSLPGALASGVGGFAREILAHEIGHHVLAPATLRDHGRLLARIRYSLPTVERHAPFVANLYTDLLVNDRLQRTAELRLADVFRALRSTSPPGAVWTLYLRICELLWSMPRGSLGGGPSSDVVEGDAWLGMRLLRVYSREWLDGAGRFAALLLPHVMEDEKTAVFFDSWHDTRDAAQGGDPAGLVEVDPDEQSGAIHPARDPELSGEGLDKDDAADAAGRVPPQESSANAPARGQCREPFAYGELLRSMGIRLTDHELAVRYYRERAQRHLVPFPSRPTPAGADPLPEGLEPWDIGQPLDEVSWLESVLESPHVVPGMTTVRRVFGTCEGSLPRREPLDLDIYVDSSGSMPNPQVATSFPALAGAIICLSALRAGARVQATLWSGREQFTSTPGFVRDEGRILRVLTGHYGGGTAFPLHTLRDTYAQRPPGSRPVHILVISDDGVSTMFDRDERGNSGWDLAEQALASAGGGGTFVLNLPPCWDEPSPYDHYASIRHARDVQGWQVFRVSSWSDLVDFAKAFSRLVYAPGSPAPT